MTVFIFIDEKDRITTLTNGEKRHFRNIKEAAEAAAKEKWATDLRELPECLYHEGWSALPTTHWRVIAEISNQPDLAEPTAIDYLRAIASENAAAVANLNLSRPLEAGLLANSSLNLSCLMAEYLETVEKGKACEPLRMFLESFVVGAHDTRHLCRALRLQDLQRLIYEMFQDEGFVYVDDKLISAVKELTKNLDADGWYVGTKEAFASADICQ